MKIIFLLFSLLVLISSPLQADTEACAENQDIGKSLRSILGSGCSRQMREAIRYKEENRRAKRAAKEILKPLCPDENEYTAVCIVMGKDANISNSTLAGACVSANQHTPLCLLTAVSKNKNDQEIINSCSKASPEIIQSL